MTLLAVLHQNDDGLDADAVVAAAAWQVQLHHGRRLPAPLVKGCDSSVIFKNVASFGKYHHYRPCGFPSSSIHVASRACLDDYKYNDVDTKTKNVYPFHQDEAQPLLDAIASLSSLPYDGAFRIFHGRGGYYCSPLNDNDDDDDTCQQHAICQYITLDWYGPVFVLTTFVEVADEYLQQWQKALHQQWGRLTLQDSSGGKKTSAAEKETLNCVYQCRIGNNVTTKVMSGQVPSPQHIVTENGLRYRVHILKGQNHGLFLDMVNGRTWVRQHATGGSNVLNLFAYTCAFSVNALAGGARQVVNVDMSKSALKIGQQNHELNHQHLMLLLKQQQSSMTTQINNNNNNIGSTTTAAESPNLGTARFLGHDIFKSWGKIKKFGPYDMVIFDPPSYQKRSFVAKRDYAKLIQRLPQLLTSKGYALICCNAPELDTHFLHNLMEQYYAPSHIQFVKRIENPASFPAVDEERSLKVLVYQNIGNETDAE